MQLIITSTGNSTSSQRRRPQKKFLSGSARLSTAICEDGKMQLIITSTGNSTSRQRRRPHQPLARRRNQQVFSTDHAGGPVPSIAPERIWEDMVTKIRQTLKVEMFSIWPKRTIEGNAPCRVIVPRRLTVKLLKRIK
jgi:hypothetical protein